MQAVTYISAFFRSLHYAFATTDTGRFGSTPTQSQRSASQSESAGTLRIAHIFLHLPHKMHILRLHQTATRKLWQNRVQIQATIRIVYSKNRLVSKPMEVETRAISVHINFQVDI